MEFDSQQKEMLSQKLWLLGYLVQPEAKCYTPTGIEETKSELTDIDVLGFGMDSFFRPQKVAVDCKTGKTSAINRAIWLKGLMADLSISMGFVISKRPIPVDHRQAAFGWRISMLQEDEVDRFFALTAGVSKIELKCLEKDAWAHFRKDMPAQEDLANLLDYRDFFFWGDDPNRSLRYVLMETREVREVLSPSQRLHVALVADSIALFGVSLAQIIAAILPVHLVVDDKDRLDGLLKAHIYGGREVYNYMDRMRRMLVSLKRLQEASPIAAEVSEALSLPEWNSFLSLIRACMEHPRSIIDVPRVLRVIAFDRILCGSEVNPSIALPGADAKCLQMTADIVSYFCAAAALPKLFLEKIRGECDDLLLRLTTATKPR